MSAFAQRSLASALALVLWACLSARSLAAFDDASCARVKLEILQEMTLERQAFDARMRIHNGLATTPLEDVQIDLIVTDASGHAVSLTADPDDTDALFYVRLDSLEQISRVDGMGRVPAAATAEIHWLVLPTAGAAQGVEGGTPYQVGAVLAYSLAGERQRTWVAPDVIFVKPLPLLTLDYFLPGEIQGDDPFSPALEPPVPFTLGLRVMNRGRGTARGLKIDSAQPRIVENRQGLLTSFVLEGAEVNGRPAAATLLADLGDLPPQSASLARWTMHCPLSGRVVAFGAVLSHVDELGGELTSLVEETRTHLLLHDVLVDLPGRDAVSDFLAADGNTYRLYESHGVDTEVQDLSATASLRYEGQRGTEMRYSLSAPGAEGPIYIEVEDPHGGRKNLRQVIRCDGKRLKPENAWLSTRGGHSHGFHHALHVFDHHATCGYTVIFDDAGDAAAAPVFQPIGQPLGVEGEPLSFQVKAEDPDGTVPSLAAAALPALARFEDLHDGTGAFSWTPIPGQAGQYDLVFSASDPTATTTAHTRITVCPATDRDCDGMADDWERHFFATLERTGEGDLDGDGVTDLEEYAAASDPTVRVLPPVPDILFPAERAEITSVNVDVVVANVPDGPAGSFAFDFELYADSRLTTVLASQSGLMGSAATLAWTIPVELSDHGEYHFRVRTTDGRTHSAWAYRSFAVNLANEPPVPPSLLSPVDGAEANSLTPLLQIANSVDVDGDALTYTFEVFAGLTATGRPTAVATDVEAEAKGVTSWAVNVPLQENSWYAWRAVVRDEHGLETTSPVAVFFVNTANEAPEPPLLVQPPAGSEVGEPAVTLTVQNGLDPDGDSLEYRFEVDRVNTFDSDALRLAKGVTEGVGTTSWTVTDLEDHCRYYWRVQADDGVAISAWQTGSFFVNRANEPPSTPTVKNPGSDSWVEARTPTLELAAAVDPDGDPVSYEFQLFATDGNEEPLLHGASPTPQWLVPLELPDNAWFTWRARSVDVHGSASDWTARDSFFVNGSGRNDPPEIALDEASGILYTARDTVPICWEDADPDSNAVITITCRRQEAGAAEVQRVDGVPEDPDGAGDCVELPTGALAEGAYLVSASIADEATSLAAPSTRLIVIDRTAPVPAIDPPAGRYARPLAVTLTVDEDAVIHFTVDGSDPTEASPHYSTALPITGDTLVKCRAVDRAGNSSAVVSAAYAVGRERRVTRFVVESPSQVTAGTPFPLTLKAVDGLGSVVAAFHGPVRLAASEGTVVPRITPHCTNGVWRGLVTLCAPAGPVTLTARGKGAWGRSGVIRVACTKPQPPAARFPDGGEELAAASLRLDWEGVPGAARYDVQVSRDLRFRDVLYEGKGIGETAVRIPRALLRRERGQGRTYYWRVRAVSECGPGEFSPPLDFTWLGSTR